MYRFIGKVIFISLKYKLSMIANQYLLFMYLDQQKISFISV
jgi:hypothetical protein